MGSGRETTMLAYSPTQQNAILTVARLAVRERLMMRDAGAILQNKFPGYFHEKRGVFVTITDGECGEERGSVGVVDAAESLVIQLVKNGAAVTQDPRYLLSFVTAADLPNLVISVTVIAGRVEVREPVEEITAGMDGVYVTAEMNGKKVVGTYLPHVAAMQDWDEDELLDATCRDKLGLPATAWESAEKYNMKFYRYAAATMIEQAPGISAGMT